MNAQSASQSHTIDGPPLQPAYSPDALSSEHFLHHWQHYFRVQHATRVALASVLATFFALFFHVEWVGWFAGFSVILMTYTPYQSPEHRMLGVVIGMVLVGIALQYAHILPLYMTYAVLLSFWAARNFAKHRYTFAFHKGMVSFNAVILLGLSDRYTASTVAYNLFLSVLMAYAAIKIVYLFLPRGFMARKIPDMLGELPQCFLYCMRSRRAKDLEALHQALQFLQAQVKTLRYEVATAACLRAETKLRAAFDIYHALYRLYILEEEGQPLEDIQPILEALYEDMQEDFAYFAQQPPARLADALARLHATLQTNRLEGKAMPKLGSFMKFGEFRKLRYAMQLLYYGDRTAQRIEAVEPHVEECQAINVYALKITLSIFITMWAVVLLHLPGEAEALISATLMAATPHVGDFIYRIRLRFLGVFLGLVVGFLIAYLSAHIPVLYFLLALLFAGMFTATYLGYKYANLAYLGFAVTTTIPLFVLFSGDIAIDPHKAVLRFLGVMSACVIVGCVTILLRPVFPQIEAEKKLHRLLALLIERIENSAHDRHNRQALMTFIERSDSLISCINSIEYFARFAWEPTPPLLRLRTPINRLVYQMHSQVLNEYAWPQARRLSAKEETLWQAMHTHQKHFLPLLCALQKAKMVPSTCVYALETALEQLRKQLDTYRLSDAVRMEVMEYLADNFQCLQQQQERLLEMLSIHHAL